MQKSLGAFALLIAAAVIGIENIALVFGLCFVAMVIIAYAVLTIKDKVTEDKEDEISFSAIEPIFPPDLVKRRSEMIESWCSAQYEREPELGYVSWNWRDLSQSANEIEFSLRNEGLTYLGEVCFAEKGHPDCHDQERVLKIKSVIKGTDVEKEWEGTGMKKVPISSIQKNIQNSLKNDKGLRKILEEAFDECLENGESIFDLDDVNLDFTDNRVKKEFVKACLKSGNFSSVHLLADGHRVKVLIGDKDPI